jgi:hypothetical protein
MVAQIWWLYNLSPSRAKKASGSTWVDNYLNLFIIVVTHLFPFDDCYYFLFSLSSVCSSNFE